MNTPKLKHVRESFFLFPRISCVVQTELNFIITTLEADDWMFPSRLY